MSHNFEVGDKVRRVSPDHDNSGRWGVVGQDYIVKKVRSIPSEIYLEGLSYAAGASPSKFILVEKNEVARAKQVLEKRGYTVTPPKPKLTGKAYILQIKDKCSGPFATSTPAGWGKDYDTIAIVDWEEGQGIEPGTP